MAGNEATRRDVRAGHGCPYVMSVCGRAAYGQQHVRAGHGSRYFLLSAVSQHKAGNLHNPARGRTGRGGPHFRLPTLLTRSSWLAMRLPVAVCVRDTAAHTSWPSMVVRHLASKLHALAHRIVAERLILAAVHRRSTYGQQPPSPCASVCEAQQLILLSIRCRSAYVRQKRSMRA